MSTVTIPASSVEKLRRLKENREEQDRVAQKLNKFRGRLNTITREKAEKYSDKLWCRMGEYYATAKTLAEEEEKLCSQLASELSALQSASGVAPVPPGKKKGQGSVSVPKSKPKLHNGNGQAPRNAGKAGPHAGGPNHHPAPGDMVAARVSPPEAEKDDWIVVKVLGYFPHNNMYEVIDEEPGDEGEPGPRKYELDASCIIAFPSAEDPSPAPEFPRGSHVLAVYPKTTSLYRATVSLSAPQRQSKNDDYILEFDDDEEEGVVGLPQRRVQFCHVVPLPEGHRQ